MEMIVQPGRVVDLFSELRTASEFSPTTNRMLEFLIKMGLDSNKCLKVYTSGEGFEMKKSKKCQKK